MKKCSLSKSVWEEPTIDSGRWEVSASPQLSTQSPHKRLAAQPNVTVTLGPGLKSQHHLQEKFRSKQLSLNLQHENN